MKDIVSKNEYFFAYPDIDLVVNVKYEIRVRYSIRVNCNVNHMYLL